MYLAYIFFLFATVSAIPSDHVEVVFPSMETSRSGVKTVKFRAFDKDVELQLEPAGDILAKNFALYNGNREKQHSVDIESLRRRLYKDSANGAALLIDDNEQPPSIEGFVIPNLSITPHDWKEITEDGRRAHRVEELTSDKDSFLSDNIILPDFQREMINFSRTDKDDECIVIEFLSVTESNFTDRFETNQALTEYVTLMYSAAETILRQLVSGIQLRLTEIHAYTKDTEPPFFKDNELEEGEYYSTGLLGSITEYMCGDYDYGYDYSSSAENPDIIMIHITRYMKMIQPDGSSKGIAAGVAFPGTVCYICYNVGVSIAYWNGVTIGNWNAVTGSPVLAHEVAHLLGVPHDGDSPEYTGVPGSPGAESCPPEDGFFMGDMEGVNSGTFSKCSKDCAQYLLSTPDASCVHKKCNSFRY